jgi:HAD superfamily hydrolase (TIGR01509 family)
MLAGIIFDLDGVIVDSHAAHMQAWEEFFQSIGKEVSDQELSFVVDGRKREDILRHFLGELSRERIEEYGAKKEALFFGCSRKVGMIPGVLEFLDTSQDEGLQVGVASSASRARVEYMLKDLGLSSRFRAVVSGDDVVAGKPDPAIFRLAAEGLGTRPDNLLVCEDAVCGVAAAKAAGMKCLAIAASGRGELLKRAGADRIVPDFRSASLADLKNLFVKN